MIYILQRFVANHSVDCSKLEFNINFTQKRGENKGVAMPINKSRKEAANELCWKLWSRCAADI